MRKQGLADHIIAIAELLGVRESEVFDALYREFENVSGDNSDLFDEASCVLELT